MFHPTSAFILNLFEDFSAPFLLKERDNNDVKITNMPKADLTAVKNMKK